MTQEAMETVVDTPSTMQIFTQDDDLISHVETIYDISPELQDLLQHVVDDVVEHLGCVGAMVATLEPDNTMPIRAYSIDIAPTLLNQLEKRLLGTTIIGPKSVAYLDDKKFQDNLSIRAVKGVNGKPEIVVSDKLYDLFRPVVNKPLSDVAQRMIGIKQVIAVPFFINDEVVGNLFAAVRREFTSLDIDFLRTLGRQAAIAIKSQRHLTETQALERVILALQSHMTDETQVLQTIVDSVVQRLNYAGAIVATLEPDNTLPVRAYAIDIAPTLFEQLQNKLGVTLNSSRATAHLNDEKFKDNLCIRAIKGDNGHPANYVISDSLYDLFRPVVGRALSAIAQKLTGIKQVIAVPFFIDKVVVGNLFVATRKLGFSQRERALLTTFAQQAAVGLRNARIYRHAEEQRKIAQVFGKMAFSAATNVHALRNHIGGFRAYLSMVKILPMLPEAQQKEILESGASIMNNLNDAAEILDNLHEPWQKHHDVPTDVNQCLNQAIKKTFLKQSLDFTQKVILTQEKQKVYRNYDNNLPEIKTSPDMLTEAFRIIIKNAAEALESYQKGDSLWLESKAINATTIQVSIRDNGIGIQPENLVKIFEMGWSSKEGKGMGFGLFWTKDYVEGMGGTIGVESVVDEGTTFYLDLPIKPLKAH